MSKNEIDIVLVSRILWASTRSGISLIGSMLQENAQKNCKFLSRMTMTRLYSSRILTLRLVCCAFRIELEDAHVQLSLPCCHTPRVLK